MQNIAGAGSPDKRLGIAVVVNYVFVDGSDQFVYAGDTPRRSLLSLMSRKNRSTMLSHEALVGVKCMLKRGCLASHFWTFAGYVRWVVFFMDQVHGWEDFLVAVFLMPPGILIGIALLAKLIAHLKGTPISSGKAFGFGVLGLFTSFVGLLVYNGFSS